MHDVLELYCKDNPAVYYSHDGHYYFDFFSLDVEGSEYDALKSIDWSKTAFGLIFVEADGSNLRKDTKVTTLLLEKGYYLVDKAEPEQHSKWYINKDWHKIYEDL